MLVFGYPLAPIKTVKRRRLHVDQFEVVTCFRSRFLLELIKRYELLIERRAEPRARKKLFMSYRGAKGKRGTTTIDVSPRGIAFYAPEPLNPDKEIKIDVEEIGKAIAIVRNSEKLINRSWRIGAQTDRIICS
jgi:hypothetical protein